MLPGQNWRPPNLQMNSLPEAFMLSNQSLGPWDYPQPFYCLEVSSHRQSKFWKLLCFRNVFGSFYASMHREVSHLQPILTATLQRTSMRQFDNLNYGLLQQGSLPVFYVFHLSFFLRLVSIVPYHFNWFIDGTKRGVSSGDSPVSSPFKADSPWA